MKRKPLHDITAMHWLAIVVLALAATACASIGRPEGGPRDETPPVYVSSNPAIGATKVSRQQIDIYFNENVQLEDAFNKVVVSPVQKENARVTSNGKHVRVELNDTLKPNTTYTIDFADAIKDLNEGNILDGFSAYFSTGDTIDTLSISGMVLEARTLEPAQGMLVGVYSNLSDTAIRTLPLERIARTNQYGQFSILNLKPGDYRVYALKDMNRDFHWDRSEDVAFYDFTVSPYVEDITVVDTLRSSTNEDSLVTRPGHAYLPNDILLTWFNEGYKPQYLQDYKRTERRRFHLNMAAPSDSMPVITIANGPMEGAPVEQWAKIQASPTLDTLNYWIADTTVLAMDSLRLSVKYLRTDTNDMLTWRTDTLNFFFKDPKPKKSKKEAESDTLPVEIKYLAPKAITSTRHEVYMPVIWGIDQPIDTLIEDLVNLEVQNDTLWLPVKGYTIEVDSMNPLQNRRIYNKWVPGEKYRLTVDSAAVTSIYNEWNKNFTHEFTVKEVEEYSNVVFNVTGLADSAAYIELLDKSDKAIKVAPVVDGKATFKYLDPGTVYARLYIDKNRNGKWDTGNLIDSIQPEEVYYYAKKINLKKNWDISLDWNIYEIALDKQKPYDIKQNKPKLKKGEKAPTDYDEDEEDEDDMFGGYNDTYNNARRNNRNNNNRGTNRSTGGFGTSNRRGF